MVPACGWYDTFAEKEDIEEEEEEEKEEQQQEEQEEACVGNAVL